MQKPHSDFIANCKGKPPKHLNNHDEAGVRKIGFVVNPVVQQVKIWNSQMIVERIIENFRREIAHKQNQPSDHKKRECRFRPPFLKRSDRWNRVAPVHLRQSSREIGDRSYNEDKPKDTHIPQSEKPE